MFLSSLFRTTREAPMHRYLLFLLLIVNSITSAQELSLSTTARSYNNDEQVWVSLSVLDAGIIPGAYTVTVSYDAEKLLYMNIIPAEEGPFSITPAAVAKNGTVTIAGFQGIVNNGNGTASLGTLIFSAFADNVIIDTSSFSITQNEVFTPEAQLMELSVTKHTTSVLLPSVKKAEKRISLSRNYLRFTVPFDGITTVRIYNLTGRTVAVPLTPSYLKAGDHGIPIGSLSSGVYLVALRGVGLNTTGRLEVLK